MLRKCANCSQLESKPYVASAKNKNESYEYLVLSPLSQSYIVRAPQLPWFTTALIFIFEMCAMYPNVENMTQPANKLVIPSTNGRIMASLKQNRKIKYLDNYYSWLCSLTLKKKSEAI